MKESIKDIITQYVNKNIRENQSQLIINDPHIFHIEIITPINSNIWNTIWVIVLTDVEEKLSNGKINNKKDIDKFIKELI